MWMFQPSIVVGLYLSGDHHDLMPVFRSLYGHTRLSFDLVLLPDRSLSGGDLYRRFGDQVPLTVAEPVADAADGFGRLIRDHPADLTVFLDGACLVGPRWLDHLSEACDGDADIGIVCPSSNGTGHRAVLTRASRTLAGFTSESLRIERAFATHPVASLPTAEIDPTCVAVARQVIEMIGGAGPSQNADWCRHFGERAERAGFRTVWARQACVVRRNEPRTAVLRRPEPTEPALVSCIMPTRGRPEFVARSLHYFLQQDYPERELIIAAEEASDLPETLPDDDRIRIVWTPRASSIGQKRNLAIAQSRGAIVAQWDDDDWYAPQRLSAQVAPIHEGRAEIVGIADMLFFELERWTFWKASRALFNRMFFLDVSGGSLVYQRTYWENSPYPDISLAEDAAFLDTTVKAGARLVRLSRQDLFMYLRHGQNTWRFASGRFLEPEAWRTVAPPPAFLADQDFYRQMVGRVGSPPEACPLVSCIMPTADRIDFAIWAVQRFLRQDYPARELVIIDDGQEPVADRLPSDPRIRVLRRAPRLSVGAKRNLGAEHARGEILCHWDDDDWSADDWISRQVKALGNNACTGLRELYFYDPRDARAWLYRYEDDGRPWVAGGTLCYRKSLWQQHRFPETDVGEDTLFVWGLDHDRVVAHQGRDGFVASIHAGNTSPKLTETRFWKPCPVATVREIMGEACAVFASLCGGCPN